MATKRILITGGTTWTVPPDAALSNITCTLIAGGAGGQKCAAGAVSISRGGGGAGGFNITTITPSFTPGVTVINYVIGAGGTGATATGNATAGGSTSCNGVSPSGGAVGSTTTAAGGAGGSGGGGANAIAGGAGGSTAASRGGGGGGGGVGLRAGGASGNAAGAGGGGGAGSTVNGASSAATVGGAGAAGGAGAGGAGAGTAGSAGGGLGGNGTVGGGGGGGGGRNTASTAAAGPGGNGSSETTTAFNFVWDGTSYSLPSSAALDGSGGGGGGGHARTSSGTGGNGGNGGLYGGGGGGGGGAQTTTGNGGNGAQGAIVMQYTTAAARTLYWVGGTGTWDSLSGSTANWSIFSGGLGGEAVPTSSDTVIFDANSGSGTVTINGISSGNQAVCANFNSSASTTLTFTVTGTNGDFVVNGNFTTGSSNTWSIGGVDMNATGTITTNGANLSAINLEISLSSGTVTISDNASFGRVTLSDSTLSLSASVQLTCTGFTAAGGNNTNLSFGGGSSIRTTGSGSVWAVSKTLTAQFNVSGTPNVIIDNPTSTATTITHQSLSSNSFRVVDFSIISGSYPLTITSSADIKSLDFTGFTGSWSPGVNTLTLYGSLTLVSGMTFTAGTGTFSFGPTGTALITHAGFTLNPIATGVGTVQFTPGTVTLNGSLSLGSGTLDLTNNSLNATSFSSSNNNARTLIMGSGTWTLSGTNIVWNCSTSTNLTLTPGTSTIVLSDTSTATRVFNGGGKTYNNLTIGGLTGTSAFFLSGSNTFNTIASTKIVAHTISFNPGITTTVSNWTVTGTAGNIVTINSLSPGLQATLTKTGGGVVEVDYLSIQDSNATPGSTWYAGSNSTNVSNNTGWIFSVIPKANYFLMF
jgi:hypothetical protein